MSQLPILFPLKCRSCMEEGKETANNTPWVHILFVWISYLLWRPVHWGFHSPTLLFLPLGTKSWLLGPILWFFFVVIEPERRVSISCLKSPRSNSLLPSLLSVTSQPPVLLQVGRGSECPISLPCFPLSYAICHGSTPMFFVSVSRLHLSPGMLWKPKTIEVEWVLIC